MKAIIETAGYFDEGKIIAIRINDEWFLFVSDIDGKKYYVNPEIVTIEK